MKRTFFLFALAAALYALGWLYTGASAQGTNYDYGTFNHAEHDTALDQTGQARISCDTCHERASASTQLYYPGHDACIQCHVQQFTTQSFEICAICHVDVKTKGAELTAFPGQRQEFGVRFDGADDKSQHVVHMNIETLPNGEKMTCSFCHAPTGTNMAFPSHPECYACHAPGVDSPAASPELSQCSICHPAAGDASPAEMSRLISTRRNDALPYRFRHGDHNRSPKIANNCARCHNVNAGVHVASSRTKEHNTGASFNCYECHRAGGMSRIVETSCGSCHGVIVF